MNSNNDKRKSIINDLDKNIKIFEQHNEILEKNLTKFLDNIKSPQTHKLKWTVKIFLKSKI